MAEALREEYLGIVDAGFLLQVDDPWLIEYLSENPATSPEQRRADAELHVEMLNHALRGIPRRRSGCTPATGSTTARASTTSTSATSRR